jgi:hypothetical protein
MRVVKWRKAGVYVLIAVPMLGVAGIAAIARQNQDAAQQQGVDPVADAARKARQQKKDAPKPKKVFTNEDVSTAPPASANSNAAPPSTSTSPAADATKDNAAATGSASSGDAVGGNKSAAPAKSAEATWRDKFRDERAKLADAERELDILQREAQKAQVQYYSDPQKAMTEQYNRKDVNEKDTKIAAKKQEIEQIKQHIADMEDELRKSGGEIGWARE